VSGGLHGVGISVVNALSSWLKLTIWRDGKEHFIEFRDGATVAPLSVVGRRARQARHRGDVPGVKEDVHDDGVRFRDPGAPAPRARVLNSGVTIVLSDMRHPVEKREEMRYEGGVEAFVKYLDRNKSPLVRRRS